MMITVLSLSPAVDKIYIIDNFAAGGLYRVGNCLQSAGGKGINVSRVAKMLGVDVRTLGFKAGSTGQWLEKCLLDLGVRTGFVAVEGQSRTNNNIIDKVNNRETEILEEGPTISGQAWEAFMASFMESVAESSVLVCSGGLPKGLGPDTYAKLIAEAKKIGIKTMLDSSGDVLKQGINACPYLIKPNLRELSMHFNTNFENDDQIVTACRTLIKRGVKVVVTSLGEKGALLVTGEGAWKAFPLKVEVLNTIGSGDSMVAGMARGLAEGLSVIDSFRLGCACGASNTEFFGIGLIDTARVDKLQQSLIIESIG
ncbi:MAG: pfkB [Eubacterium sp.]|nr:pfkB [Eubacterium sp.]